MKKYGFMGDQLNSDVEAVSDGRIIVPIDAVVPGKIRRYRALKRRAHQQYGRWVSRGLYSRTWDSFIRAGSIEAEVDHASKSSKDYQWVTLTDPVVLEEHVEATQVAVNLQGWDLIHSLTGFDNVRFGVLGSKMYLVLRKEGGPVGIIMVEEVK